MPISRVHAESELILNVDASIYHLHLLPEDLADTVLLVGDPERVPKVSRYFDRVELKKKKREFVTHTGYIGSKRLTVISTGIGPDNIDIVLSELDALRNIDLASRQVRKKLQPLQLIRLGTSGALQTDIAVDSILISSHGLGMDGLMSFYRTRARAADTRLFNSLCQAAGIKNNDPRFYLNAGDEALIKLLSKDKQTGITLTCPGFYGPQGRRLRAPLAEQVLIEKWMTARVAKQRISNAEMETAAIYGMARLLGHKACSVNAILANRPLGHFSKKPARTVDGMIRYVLEKISAS